MRSDTTPAGDRDLTAIWDATRSRVTSLVTEHALDTDGAAGGDAAVATVPGATVRDVVGHLIGVATKAAEAPDALRGEAITPPSTGAAPRGAAVADLLAAWTSAADQLSALVASDSMPAVVLITDAVMCEHDLRATFDVPGCRDDAAVKVALDELAGRFSDRVAAAGLPPLRVTVEQWGTIIGSGPATSCLVADRFEFVRGMAGRRSAAEIGRWNWGTDPAPYLPMIAEVALPEQEVRERDPRIPAHMRDREFVL